MSDKIIIFALVVMATSVWYANVVEAQRVVTDGLIAFWTFDRSDIEDETVKDVLGDNDGTIVGDPRIVNGKIEEALELNGVSDYFDLGYAKDFDLPIAAAECWFKTSSGAEMRIFAPGATSGIKPFLVTIYGKQFSSEKRSFYRTLKRQLQCAAKP